MGVPNHSCHAVTSPRLRSPEPSPGLVEKHAFFQGLSALSALSLRRCAAQFWVRAVSHVAPRIPQADAKTLHLHVVRPQARSGLGYCKHPRRPTGGF